MSYAIEDKLILRNIKTYFVRKGSSFTIFLTKQEMDLTADMITRLNLILHNFWFFLIWALLQGYLMRWLMLTNFFILSVNHGEWKLSKLIILMLMVYYQTLDICILLWKFIMNFDKYSFKWDFRKCRRIGISFDMFYIFFNFYFFFEGLNIIHLEYNSFSWMLNTI